jgi:hypothetical protein
MIEWHPFIVAEVPCEVIVSSSDKDKKEIAEVLIDITDVLGFNV